MKSVSYGSLSGGDRALVGCAGFGGPEIAFREAGIEAAGIEIDAAIAEVNRRNGGHCLTADLLDVDPADYIGWLLFHFSPPCSAFSLANNGRGETELDLALARKIAQFVVVGQPQFFILENVWLYRKSKSWAIVLAALREMGYGVEWWHLNSANYGVPQSRKRMIVIARWDGRQPQKPFPTHAKKPDMFTRPWNGWYQAIEDLIPTLQETQFAPWQWDRMPEELKTYLMMTSNTNRNGVDNVSGRGWLDVNQPANTVCAEPGGGMPRAFILGQGNYSKPKGANEPSDTVTANTNQTGIKAFIMNNANAGSNNGKGTIRQSDEPMFTVTAMEKSAPLKAFIVGGHFQTPQDGPPRVVQNKGADDPIWTICATDHLDARIHCDGKTVSLTVRCLARFQDFPDWFKLPGEFGLKDDWITADISARELSCRGIGNALPPGVYRAVLRSLGFKE